MAKDITVLKKDGGVQSVPVARDLLTEGDIRPKDFETADAATEFADSLKAKATDVKRLMDGTTADKTLAVRLTADVLKDTIGTDQVHLYHKLFKREFGRPGEELSDKFELVEAQAASVIVDDTLKGDDAVRLADQVKTSLGNIHKDSFKVDHIIERSNERIERIGLLMHARAIKDFKGRPLEELGVDPEIVGRVKDLERVLIAPKIARGSKASAEDIILAAGQVDEMNVSEVIDSAFDDPTNVRFSMENAAKTLELRGPDINQRRTLPSIAGVIKHAIGERLTGETSRMGIVYETSQEGIVGYVARNIASVTRNVMDKEGVEKELNRHDVRVTTKRVVERIIQNPKGSENPLKDAMDGGIRPLA